MCLLKVHITNRLFEAGQQVLLAAPQEEEQRADWARQWARQRTLTVLHLRFLVLSASAVVKDWIQIEEVRGWGELAAEEQLNQCWCFGLP